MSHLGISLLFKASNQEFANKTLERMVEAPWNKLELPQSILSALPPGLSYYLNSEGGLVWGIKTGCHDHGVQLLLLVKDATKFQAMSSFYKQILPESPESAEAPGDVLYQIFPLSRYCELMMVCYPDIDCVSTDCVSLTVQVKDENDPKLKDAKMINSQKWTTRDPEGNLVTLITIVRNT